MVDITPLIPKGKQRIDAYAPAQVTVNGQDFGLPVLILPDQTLTSPLPPVFPPELLSLDALRLALAATRLLLIGTGERFEPLPHGLQKELKSWDIVAEPMDTGAACRTYNVLLAEERPVAALLFAATQESSFSKY